MERAAISPEEARPGFDPSLPRCSWAGAEGPRPDPLMVEYHDADWGVPLTGDTRAVRAPGPRELPGRPVVVDDPAQARGVPDRVPRASIRSVVAAFGPADRDATHGRRRDRPQPPEDRRDDRQRRPAARGGRGARLVRRVPRRAACPGRRSPCHRARPCGQIPATTPVSDALSADLRRRGFGFVGSTIMYAFMQSVGLVDDHLPGCFRYRG